MMGSIRAPPIASRCRAITVDPSDASARRPARASDQDNPPNLIPLMKKRLAIPIALLAAWMGSVNTHAAPHLVTGFIKREVFLNIEGTTVAELTASPNFVAGQPDGVSLLG